MPAPPHGHSFKWVPTRAGFQPSWTTEPSRPGMRLVARTILGLPQHSGASPRFKLLGTDDDNCSKSYAVKHKEYSFQLRVILSVEPGRKTLSLVATMEYVRRKFRLPVQGVRGFDARWDNHVEFEWVALDNVEGKSLKDMWEVMEWDAKEKLVKKLAGYTAMMLQRRFDRIGSLMPDVERRIKEGVVCELIREDQVPVEKKGFLAEILRSLRPEEEKPPYHVGQMVSKDFFWGERFAQDVPRGPFESSADWLSSRLRILETERIDFLMRSNDRAINAEVESALQSIRRLQRLVSKVFRSETEETVLSLSHLTFENVFVDDAGALTCLTDWECVPVLPLWKACDLPSFLQGRERTAPPEETDNVPEEENENEDYKAQVREYELTLLRGVFLGELERLEERWTREFETGRAKRDVELAVRQCDKGMDLEVVASWLDAVESRPDGLEVSLREMLS